MTERQPAREGAQQGVGEEEAGSQQRSPMRDSIPERQDHALSRRQMLNNCATQAPLNKTIFDAYHVLSCIIFFSYSDTTISSKESILEEQGAFLTSVYIIVEYLSSY